MTISTSFLKEGTFSGHFWLNIQPAAVASFSLLFGFGEEGFCGTHGDMISDTRPRWSMSDFRLKFGCPKALWGRTPPPPPQQDRKQDHQGNGARDENLLFKK